ncbi:monocarboxylate transporter 9-like [Arctopsyche grandis]|uniref:monocarboxylate transporter 9-like n=1 Tax=Arctopsyche grandis TaxID=121162 RepID=UPI00406D6D14
MDHAAAASPRVQRNDNAPTSAPNSDVVHGPGGVSPQQETAPPDDPETPQCNSSVDKTPSTTNETSPLLKSSSNGNVLTQRDTPPIGVILKHNATLLQSIDEGNSEDSESELASLQDTKPQRPKSIVKTPSQHSFSSAKRKIVFKTDSLRSPNGRRDSIEGDRPVLHVQFQHGCTDGSVSTATREACASPAFSLGESSGSSSEDDSSLGLSEARPPDGGWGWVIVFATFMVNLIADGITFSFGVMFVYFLDYFGEGKAKTAWIGSLFMAMPLLSGPIASFLTDRYGCRKMCIIGSILACLGFIASVFAPNMETLFFTFGIVSGFGLSLCYVAAVVIVAYYFEKKRSLATGLSVCGSGIGTFIFAPVTQMLLNEYGWRGTTLILAGLFLNITVCGVLMKDLPWTAVMAKAKAEDRKRTREQKRLKKQGSSADSFSDNKSTNTVGTGTQLLPGGDGNGAGANPESVTRQFCSLVNLPTYVNNGENVPVEVLELLATHKNVYNVLMQNYPSMLISSRSFSDSGKIHELGTRRGLAAQEITSPPATIHSPVGRSARTPPRPTTAYLKDLRIHRHSLTYRGAMLNIKRYRLRASSCPNIYRNSMTTIAKEKLQWYSGLWEFWDLIVDMLDFSHFSNPRFSLFALSNFLLYTWYDVPYVYIADNALEMGFSDTDASMLISLIGIINMIGEIFLGWAGDWDGVDASMIYAVCMLFCGGVTAMVPLLSSYSGLCAASGAFGLFIAANYSLTSIILVELITLENFTNAYGLLLLVQGVANLIGPPLAGWIYDITGTYELSFYLAGLFIALSGLLLFILPVTKRLKRYRALRRKESSASSKENSAAMTSNGIVKMEANNRIFV